MLGKNKSFLFQAPLTKQEKKSAVKPFEDNVQVIVCGSQTKNVITGLKKPELTITEDTDMYAFQYNVKGNLNIDVKVEVTSDINYKEIRKKKNKEQSFAHDDSITKNLHSGTATKTSYNPCVSNFQSTLDTFVVIATNDNAESERVMENVKQNLGERKLTECIILQHPESDGRTSMLYRAELSNHITYYASRNNNFPKLAECIQEKLDEHTQNHTKNIEQALVDEIRENILKSFEETAHKKADQHFADHKHSCRII